MKVVPSFYMNLQNRLRATQGNRPLMIQPGDVVRGLQAASDLRVIAGLVSVPAPFFQGCTGYNTVKAQTYDFRFADGVSPLGAYGTSTSLPQSSAGLVYGAIYPHTTATVTGTDFTTGAAGATTSASWFTGPVVSGVTGTSYVAMTPLSGTSSLAGATGDWDTGPGLCPDGAMINLPDAGTSQAAATAYFTLAALPVGATRLAPNALVPSPVIFGSLPTGINPTHPTQSLPLVHALVLSGSLVQLLRDASGRLHAGDASGFRFPAGLPGVGQFLDAGDRALRHQYLHGHGRKDQPELPDRAVHLPAPDDGPARGVEWRAHSRHPAEFGQRLQDGGDAAGRRIGLEFAG
jgi:hypothetical protein